MKNVIKLSIVTIVFSVTLVSFNQYEAYSKSPFYNVPGLNHNRESGDRIYVKRNNIVVDYSLNSSMNGNQVNIVKKEANQQNKSGKSAKDLVEITRDLQKWNSKEMYVSNKSSSRKIIVTIEVQDYYEHRYHQTFYKEYTLNPGEKKYIGKTDSKYEGSIAAYHEYYYSISGAYFSN